MLASPVRSTIVDLQQLHEWLQTQAPLLRESLTNSGIRARDIILPFLLDPQVRHIRQCWRNDRAVLGEEEILLLLLLLTRKKKVLEINRRAFVTAIGVLLVMSAPDPWPARVRIDFGCRKLLFPD
jgi:hypothetical protein